MPVTIWNRGSLGQLPTSSQDSLLLEAAPVNMLIYPVSTFQGLILTTVLVVGAYVYRSLHEKRVGRNAHIPQLPSSLLWGHLLQFDKFTKQGHADRHPGKEQKALFSRAY